MRYRLGAMFKDSNYAYISLEGAGDDDVTLQCGMPGIDIVGADGKCKLSILRQDGTEFQSDSFSIPTENVTLKLVNQISGPAMQFRTGEKICTLPMQEIQSKKNEEG